MGARVPGDSGTASGPRAAAPSRPGVGAVLREQVLHPLSRETRRTPSRLQRRLAAVLSLDVKGYSLLMARDEEDAHGRVGVALADVVRQVQRCDGRVFSFSGDGLMAEFASSVTALTCALRLQAGAARRNAKLEAARRIEYRIGINSGDIVDQDGRMGGDAVNVAARLEQLAKPGSIYLSQAVYEQVVRIVAADYSHIGERRLRNIAHAVNVYCAVPSTRPAGPLLAPAPVSDYRPSLAVLPFRTLRPDQEDAYFAAGMVDDIIHALGGLRDLLVIARSSTLGFAGSAPDPVRAGRELGVRYILHGSVRRDGDRLRIAAELCEADAGGVLWAERFDGAGGELFDLQDRIALRVAGTIAPQVREQQLRMAMRKHPDSMTAYDLVLQAMDVFYRMQRDAFDRAYELLQAAIAHDPKYAPAWANCAYWHITRIGQGWTPDEQVDKQAAAHASDVALECDGTNAQALALSGHMQSYLFKNYDRALVLLGRALVAGPNCSLAWCLSSLTAGFLGDGKAAVQRAEHALRLSPLGPDVYWYETVLSQAYYISARYDDSVQLGRKSYASNNAHAAAIRTLIAGLVAVGELAEARAVAQRLMTVDPGFRLSIFLTRTPLRGEILVRFAERLRSAGLPD